MDHPFGDGNGRTGRLLELAILLEAGLPQPVCHLLSNHYNLTRASYYREPDRGSRTSDGIYGFIAYAWRKGGIQPPSCNLSAAIFS